MTDMVKRKIASNDAPQMVPGNTTLTLIVSNQKLDSRELAWDAVLTSFEERRIAGH